MNFSKILVAALVALAVNASAVPPAAPAATPAPIIKLGSVTGTVQITTPDGGTMNVKAGDPSIEIPAGSKVVVLTGSAVVESGGVIVNAGAGDTFTVNSGAGGVISVTVSVGDVSVKDSSGKSVTVKKGEVSTTKFVPAPAAKPAATATKSGSSSPESIPATTTASSPVQETVVTSSCSGTVSPSAPCP